ncbi:DUF4198 domain-containing protein [Altericroceibacterium endophyticum]|uniref:DUF4198 domain-containing protein n=1 Tax=Altericroceibacterium endophyticum TaxID=1808508 RepID=A0A6I4T491_9SPHN|nr:DUF4198 domain-containing protein [Altericroceibacterium endophyticum]MXO64961.1 DUF4198 domain-containing protein [Altericroceibacterium endophyticum]
MFKKSTLAAAGLMLGLSTMAATPAQAHRAWLLPSMTVLAGDDETVSVDAAISNELFVFEHHAMPLDDLVITGPDGTQVEPAIIGSGRYRSVFDVPLKEQGTYRIAIARNGMMGFYELNGERKRWRGSKDDLPGAIPDGATNVRLMETASRTETFATLGAPTDTALQPSGVGLEMIPVTHPNDLVATEAATMRFVLDGEPVEGMDVEFVEGGTRYRDNAGIQTLTTDANGEVSLMAPEAGMYFIEASQGSRRGEQTDGPARRASYTAVLEFMPL